MSEFQVLEESPLSLTDLKKSLKGLQAEAPLSFRGEKTNTYLESFALYSDKESQEIVQKIAALNIPRLKDRHIVKVVDVMPKDLDSLRLLLSTETLTIKDEDLKKILDVIPQ
jgi:DNA-directed RNA polymerase subunit F